MQDEPDGGVILVAIVVFSTISFLLGVVVGYAALVVL
jgi:hypothetical protein